MKNTLLPAVLLAIFSLATTSCDPGPATADQKAEMDEIFEQLPESSGLVNDFEEILEAGQEQNLSQHLQKINATSLFEVVLVTTDSIYPFEDIVGYATALGNKWNIGDDGKNNGLVIVLSSRMGQAGIAPAHDIEDIFTDEVTQRIINEHMIPHFIKGDFYAGMERALREIDEIADNS